MKLLLERAWIFDHGAHRPNRHGREHCLHASLYRCTLPATLRPQLLVIRICHRSPLRLTVRFVLVLVQSWIQADVNRYGGANKCLLWKTFASRGLGVNAANHNDDSTVPADC